MNHGTRTVLMACSLVAAVCLGVMGARGYWRGEAVSVRAGRTYFCAGHARGRMAVVWDRRSPDVVFGWSAGGSAGFDLGLSLGAGEGPVGFAPAGPTVGNVVWFPVWPGVVIAGVPAGVWWRRMRREGMKGFEVRVGDSVTKRT